MSLHPGIQVGSEVAIRDRRPPWDLFGGWLWRTCRVVRVTPTQRAVDLSSKDNAAWRRLSGAQLDQLHPLTDEIRAAIAHESRLRGVWLRLMRLVNVSVEGPRWPERVTPEQARRVEELLTEIETLTGVRSQGGGQ